MRKTGLLNSHIKIGNGVMGNALFRRLQVAVSLLFGGTGWARTTPAYISPLLDDKLQKYKLLTNDP